MILASNTPNFIELLRITMRLNFHLVESAALFLQTDVTRAFYQIDTI